MHPKVESATTTTTATARQKLFFDPNPRASSL